MSNEHRMGTQPPLNVPQEQLQAEIERLTNERDNYKLGFEARCQMLSDQSARFTKVEDGLRAKLEWFEKRQVFFDKLTETVDRNPSNPSYLHAILEGLRLWDTENPKP